jgi:hypothetical protein
VTIGNMLGRKDKFVNVVQKGDAESDIVNPASFSILVAQELLGGEEYSSEVLVLPELF